MGLILRNNNTPEKLFGEAVNAAMHDVLCKVNVVLQPKKWRVKKMALKSKKDLGHSLRHLHYKINGNPKRKLSEGGDSKSEFIVFDSMDEILERGEFKDPYKSSEEREKEREKERKRQAILKEYNCDFEKTAIGIEQMFGERWVSSQSKVHNYVWQEVYLEIFESISYSSESSKIMKAFSDQIACEYGIAVWNGIFDENQRFFIMIWRTNTSYSRSNPKQKELISLIKSFYKSIKKASRKLGKEFRRLDLDYSSADLLEDFFRALWNEIKQDENVRRRMFKIRDYFAENFSRMLWYGRFFSELQLFVLVYSEVCRAWQFLKQ